MKTLESWLDGLEDWFNKPVKRDRFYKMDLEGIQGIIEVGHSRKSGLITGAYFVHSDNFDGLIHGKPCSAGMIVVQCRFVQPPYLSVYAVDDDARSLTPLKQAIVEESQLFFEVLPNLAAVYKELIALEPEFPQAHPHPRAKQLREMFAGVVAFLMQREWRPHIDRALAMEKGLSTDWVRTVADRLNAQAG